jgi:hypothetical protein
MSWLTSLLSRGGRALVVAITMLPVLIFVILSAPAWIVWPWLDASRRDSVHRMVEQLTEWTRDVLHHTAPLTIAEPSSHDVIAPASQAKGLEARSE